MQLVSTDEHAERVGEASLRPHKRVLVVLRHPLGGIRTYIHYNYPALSRAGYVFTFVAPAGEHFDQLRSEMQSTAGAEFIVVPRGESTARMAFAVRRLMRSRHYCMIHSHGFSAAVAAVLANLGGGVPHVVTSHDVIRPEAQFAGLAGAIKQRLFGRVLSMSDRIIAVTEDARENHLQCLPALGRRTSKVVTIVHGIDTRRFTRPSTSTAGGLRARLGIPKDVFLLAFLGRFMKQKGFVDLIAAMDQLLASGSLPRAVHLLAVGSGDMLVNYRDILDRRPEVSRRVTFLDHVPNVMPIFAEIDLLVMPSLWEACGLLAMEAMCAGVPVVGTDCIGLREVLHGTPSMVVPAGNADALAVGLDRAIRSPWAEAARRYAPEAQRRFDVGPAAARLREVFDEFTA